MRKVIVFTMLFVALATQAATVSQTKALELAQQFVTKDGPRRAASTVATSQLSLAHAATNAIGEVDFYVFNQNNDGGYIIIAGDDASIPVLGYADSGNFDAANIPDNMQWWLSECQREIEYLRLHPEQARQAASTGKSVKPLVTTYWNQSSPYNNNCPTYTSGSSTYRCVTGCVATAAAQIMNYHEWPKKGTGSHSYTTYINSSSSNSKTLSCDFSQSEYDWDNMLDVYDSNSSSTANAAVAKLMSDVGISVDMSYGSSSGAQSSSVPYALYTYFGYDKSATFHNRSEYTVSEWENLIRADLDAKRPVYYSGRSSAGGHAFVCDGYDAEGYFHFNWGWGGKSNGYFILTVLNPSDQGIGSFEGGYNNSQGCITNIMPDQGGSPVVKPTSGACTVVPQVSSVTLGNSATFKVSSISMTGSGNWSTLYWGYAITATDLNPTSVVGDYQWTVDASGTSPGVGYIMNSSSFTPPTSLAEGKYYVRMVYYMDGEIGFFKGSSPSNYVVDMEVKNNTAYFTTHVEQAYIVATDIELSSNPIYTGQTYNIKAKVTNNGTNDYYGGISVAIMSGSEIVDQSDKTTLGIAPNATVNISLDRTAPTSAGTYTLALLNEADEVIGSIPVTIENSGSSFSLSLVSNIAVAASEMPANDFQATATVKNTGGTFSGQLQCWIVGASSTSILATITSDFVTIKNGETVTVPFKGEFAGAVGSQYRTCLRNPNDLSSNYRWSSFVYFTVCAPKEDTNPYDVNNDGSVDVADINVIVAALLNSASTYNSTLDLNGDGSVDIADINVLVAYLLNN